MVDGGQSVEKVAGLVFVLSVAVRCLHGQTADPSTSLRMTNLKGDDSSCRFFVRSTLCF